MTSQKQIADWCEENLFGERVVQGIRLELTPTQKAVRNIAVEVIMKWEAKDNG